MISVYDKGNTNYDGNGSVVLLPLECSHTQVAAGKYDLTLVHPIDPEGKWQHLVPENAIIKAPVQEEKIESAKSGIAADLYQTTEAAALRSGTSEPESIIYQTWVAAGNYTVGSKVTTPEAYHKNWQATQYDPESGYIMVPPYNNAAWWRSIADYTSGSPIIQNLKSGTKLYLIEDTSSTWMKVTTLNGVEGYIKKSQVEFVRHLTPSETAARTITTQLFRIKSVNIDTKSRRVTATAEHVSYDLAGVLVKDAKISRMNAATALSWIEGEFMIDYQGTIATDMTSDDDGTYTGEIKGKNAMYALLDPDKGIVAAFDAMYRRDNWDLFVMKKKTKNRGFYLRYRKNMIGVSWNMKSDNLINRVVPIAKAEDGSDLYLSGTVWVNSPDISDHPVIRMEQLRVNGQVGKDDGTETATNWTASTLRAEMRKKARERFSVDKVDQIVHEITVDFEMLGDTEEYMAMQELEKALMYDTVTAIHEEIGLHVTMEVTEIEYDCIRKKVKALKLSNISRQGDRSISGFNVFNNSITGDKLASDAADYLRMELNL